MMTKSLRLRTKLLLMLIVPMLLILGAMSFYAFYGSRNILNEQIVQTASYMVESKSSTINASLKEKEALVATIAKVLGERSMTQVEEIAFLKQVKASRPGIQSAYTGYEDKSCADSQGVTEKEKPAGYDPRTREWYKTALRTSEVDYTEIYESTAKQLSAGVVKKIVRDGKAIGVAGIGIDVQPIHQLAKEFTIGKTGYAAILDEKGNFVYHPNFGLKDNILKVENGAIAEYGRSLMKRTTTVQTGNISGVEMLLASSPIGDTGWTFAVFVPKAEMLEQVYALGMHSLVSGVVGLVLLGSIILLITLQIVRRIKGVEDMAEKVAQGDLTMDTQNTAGIIDGDEIDNLKHSFVRMTVNLRNLIAHVHSSAGQVTTSAEQFSESSRQSAEAASTMAAAISTVTQGSEAQVHALDQVSTVVAEMSANMEELATTANRMAKVAEKATLATDAGQQAIGNAAKQMDSMVRAAGKAKAASGELEDSSKQIGEIVQLISSIAGQTNLLALNAAIEAARAGAQGRGFAVVAEEVRKLAEQSERAAQQITGLIQRNHHNINNVVESIETAIANVDQGVTVVGAAGVEFQQIAYFVKEVVSQVRSISGSLAQLAVGSQQIVASVNEVEKTCQEATGELQTVSAAVQEQSAFTEEIASACTMLSRLAEQLKAQVSIFRI
ncbi:methyl-accepting chemotaxis protein [Anaerospora hongkongensis]|uniref:methyl-accepting chemotaxis protein n=1 Tax=Anaerospora hongkongensis TaxID=244830 RepID=UPI0028A2C908|nr:methyl-accepting chemotaxis protein [Anaerospora hongkongensis]